MHTCVTVSPPRKSRGERVRPMAALKVKKEAIFARGYTVERCTC